MNKVNSNIEHLDHIYLYDPVTGYKTGEIHKILNPADPVEENSTNTVPPVYDPDIATVKYSNATEEWIIVPLNDPLRSLKNIAKGEVDREIRSVSRKHITPVAQDAGLYALKYDEALTYIENGEPTDLTDYPFINVEVTITSETAIDCANNFILKYDEWIRVLADVELIRLTAKRDIEAVTSDANTLIADTKNEIDTISANAVEQLINL